jgi:hypothetical protein
MNDATQQAEVITSADETEVKTDATEESSTEVQGTEQKNPVQGKINKLTAKNYQKQREIDVLRAENEKLKATNTASSSQKEMELVEPALPADIYDEAAMRKYHEDVNTYNRDLIRKESLTATNNTLAQRQEKEQQQALEQSRKQELTRYAQTGLDDGLTVEQMQHNEQVIIQSGMKAEVGAFLMSEPNAAKMADHLAKNPDVLEEINQLPPMQAAVKLASLRQAANGEIVKTNAPDPIETVTGGGAAESDELDGIEWV